MRPLAPTMMLAAAVALLAVAVACESGGGAAPTPVTPLAEREEFAQIEAVEIEKVAAKPPNASLVVLAGLPNRCYAAAGHRNLAQDEDTISVEVIILKRESDGGPCEGGYNRFITRIPLESGIVACQEYKVTVNGETFRVTAIDPDSPCDGPAPTPTPAPAGTGAGDDMKPVKAPIDAVEVVIAESHPPQYFLAVTSGLRNGCVQFDSYEVSRLDRAIEITVTNLEPADKDRPCTDVYETVETRIALGSEFEPGQTYTININDFTTTFVTQGTGGEAPPGGPVTATALDVPFVLKAGETALITNQGIELGFIEILEDSRCPTDVVCIWAGRAVVLVSLIGDGQELAQGELVIGGGSEDSPTRTFGRYTVEFLDLKPHPVAAETGGGDQPPDYTATFVVSLATAGSTGDDDQDVSGPVGLLLRASPIAGRPLVMRFVVEIVGGPDNNQDLYCIGTEWDFGDGMGVAMMPGCIPWSPDDEINRLFEIEHTYKIPGTYQLNVTVGPLSAGPLSVEVR